MMATSGGSLGGILVIGSDDQAGVQSCNEMVYCGNTTDNQEALLK